MTNPDVNLGTENWSVLESEYQNCVQLILSVNAKTIVEKAKDPAVISKVEDRGALIKNIKVMNQDLNSFVRELETIHDTHKYKKGMTRTPDELIKLYGVWEDYVQWVMKFNNVLVPNVHTILNQIHYDTVKEEIPFNNIQLDMEILHNER